MNYVLLIAWLVVLAGCKDIIGEKTSQTPAPQSCYSIMPNTGSQPSSPILLDSCTGKSWLLVKNRMGENPDDGYTYEWMTIYRNDFKNPVLVSR